MGTSCRLSGIMQFWNKIPRQLFNFSFASPSLSFGKIRLGGGLGGGLHGGGLVVVVFSLNMDIGSGLHVRVQMLKLVSATGGGLGGGLCLEIARLCTWPLDPMMSVSSLGSVRGVPEKEGEGAP